MIDDLIARFIAILIYRADRSCRNELNSGAIANERDYVSNLANLIRRPFGFFFEWNLGIAHTLSARLEQEFGCDSIMIFRFRDKVKIGLYEAKWPRYFSQNNYAWDSLNSEGVSRFTSQIKRQQKWISEGFVMWEMFFNESPVGAQKENWDELGSTCVLHEVAETHFDTRKNGDEAALWRNQDLDHLLKSSLNINQIVYRMLSCRYGELFDVANYSVTINDYTGQNKIEIPIPRRSEMRNGLSDRIRSFMENRGLSNYAYYDLIEFDQ